MGIWRGILTESISWFWNKHCVNLIHARVSGDLKDGVDARRPSQRTTFRVSNRTQRTISLRTMRGRFGKVIGSATLVSISSLYAWITYKKKTDEGFARAVKLYSIAGPVVFAYRTTELKHSISFTRPRTKEKRDDEWRALDEKYSTVIVDLLNELQGMYTKYGQTGAGLTNTFSPIWIEKLRTLEDSCTPKGKEVVAKTIFEETGKNIDDIFATFDETPLGSASIGQVHRATLRDGTEVAVKVQYPEAQRLFRRDMKTIRTFFQLFAPEQVIILDELSRSFEKEFDYLIEASNLNLVSRNLTRAGFIPGEAAIPRPFDELCTRRLLVMELLKGPKLYDGLRSYISVLAAKEGLTAEEFEEMKRREIEENGVPEKYDGPSSLQIASYLRFMRFRDTLVNSLIWLYNVFGCHSEAISYVSTSLPPNAPRVMDTLMRIHGHELLVDGIFNADPHAGNFLLLPDDRIGLIDYGATKELSREERLICCVLYVALARGDEDMLYDIAVAGGYKSKHMRKDIIMKLTRLGFDTFGRDLIGDGNVQQFIDKLYAEDPYEEVADNLVMAQFLSIRLRSVGMQMGHPVVCSNYWGEIAEKALEDEGMPYEWWNLERLRENNARGDGLRIAKGA